MFSVLISLKIYIFKNIYNRYFKKSLVFWCFSVVPGRKWASRQHESEVVFWLVEPQLGL